MRYDMPINENKRDIVVDTLEEFEEVMVKLNEKRTPTDSVKKRVQALKGINIGSRHHG